MNDKPPPQTPQKPASLPREYTEVGIDPAIIKAPAMAIWFDQALFDRAKQIAGYLAKAEGFVPPHLLGKHESCFAVVERSLAWKLSPFMVANATYQTPSGRVGFEGKLCQAALEQSGKLEGGVEYEWLGDWDQILGKFEIRSSQRSGKDYAVPTWTREEAARLGLGVVVAAKLRGEDKPRTWKMLLSQCYPLNSTLWATDPKTQICYTTVRRFSSLAMPSLFMGVEFDREGIDDDSEMVRAARARDITPPAPAREDFKPADPAAGAEGPPNPHGTKADTAPNGSATGDSSGQESTGDNPAGEPEPEDENQDNGKVMVSEGGTWFAVATLADAHEWFMTEDAVAFTDEILAEAMRQMKDVRALNKLWDRNSPQFQHLPHDMGQRIRDQWPRVAGKKKPDPEQPGNLV
jgi:hypothetical protein